MRKVPIHEAIGLPLGHDISEISGERRIKRRAFRRGHIVTPADVDRLLDLGKSSIYVWDDGSDLVHEDDAALALAPRVAGDGVEHDPEPSEGKIAFRATRRGVLRIDAQRLLAVNLVPPAALPTLPNNYPVQAGQRVAAFRIVPLTCTPDELAAMLAPLDVPLLMVQPYQPARAAILVTGTEVHEGRIKDGFVPRLSATLAAHGVPVVASEIVPDQRDRIVEAVARLTALCDLLLITGGTSVDPDDITASAMAQAGVEIGVRGLPIQPGNNLTLGHLREATVVAVPAAALFHQATALDLLLPRLLCGERFTPETVAPMALGGLAQPGADDHFPDCTFGAGGWR